MMLDKSTIQHRLLALLCAKQESRHWDSVNKQKEKTLWGTGSRMGGGPINKQQNGSISVHLAPRSVSCARIHHCLPCFKEKEVRP